MTDLELYGKLSLRVDRELRSGRIPRLSIRASTIVSAKLNAEALEITTFRALNAMNRV